MLCRSVARCSSPFLWPWAPTTVSVTHGQCDVGLTSHQQNVTALWPVSNYRSTARRQRHTGMLAEGQYATMSSQTRPVSGGYYGGCNPPKFNISNISKIFWVNLWQQYYSDSTVFKFCTSMWLFSALAPAFYNGCGLLAIIIFFQSN